MTGVRLYLVRRQEPLSFMKVDRYWFRHNMMWLRLKDGKSIGYPMWWIKRIEVD